MRWVKSGEIGLVADSARHAEGNILTKRFYTVFGLLIESEIEIPELPWVDDPPARNADVRIALGEVPAARNPVKHIEIDIDHGAGWISLDPGRGVRFLVHNGSSITVYPYREVSTDEMRLYLLGSAMGALCHQRDLLPLHGNAIVANGCAVAICGASGAGKSTLAAEFERRGYGLICDDVCVVSFDGNGGPVAWPGIPRLKLWDDSLAGLGMSVQGLESIVRGSNKYNVPATRHAQAQAYPLKTLYNLRDADRSFLPQIARLNVLETANVLTGNTYRRRFREISGDVKTYLAQVRQTVEHVQAFDFIREIGFDKFPSETDRLECHILEVARRDGA
jgi:hypothetical protein